MSADVSKVRVEPCQVIFNDVDLGLTEGDIELKPTENSVDIVAHQTGSNVLDSIRTGKKMEVAITLIETSAAQVKAALLHGGGSTGAVAEISHLTCVADVSDSLHGKTFALIAQDGSKHLFQLKTSAIVAPSIPGWTVHQISITTGDVANTVADSVAAAIDALSQFVAPNPAAAIITVTQATAGQVASGADVLNSGFTFAVVTPGTSLLTGWGKTKDFTSMLADAAKLVFHPVVNADADLTEDLAIWKAYPVIGSITESGEKPKKVSITFKVFPDSTKADAIHLFALGDHS